MSLDNAYDNHDAIGLTDLIRRGDVKASEVLDQARALVESRNPSINAIIREIDDAGEIGDGPFSGVPFLMKDLNMHVAGVPTTNGSRFFADLVPDHDSEMVARYRRAGLVIFGKTNTPELGINASTEPLLFGPTRNPWNVSFSAGGSSGGAAAAVAAGIVPVAHASDGGGSIRIPASCCGLFGLKPTRGRNSFSPDAGEGWGGMSTGHVVSRSVRDSAALLDVTAGPVAGDPYWAPPPARPFIEETRTDPGRLRIAWAVRPNNGSAVDPECLAAVEAAAALCERLGHDVEEETPTITDDRLGLESYMIIASNTAATVDDRARTLGRPPADDELEPLTRQMIEHGRGVTGPQYAAAIKAVHRAGREAAVFFSRFDVLLTPTMGAPPPPLGHLDTTKPEKAATAIAPYIAFTALWNVTGQPAMSVPLHWTAGGLPVGVQFVGRFGDEATLFRLGAQLEVAAPWAARRPPQ